MIKCLLFLSSKYLQIIFQASQELLERAKKMETDALKKEIKTLKDQRIAKNVRILI